MLIDASFPFQPDDREEGIVPQFGDDNFMDVRIEADQDVLDQIVRHRTWGCDFLDFEGDGIGLVNADPDWKNRVAADVFQNHDGHVGDRIHHEPANFHFDFHRGPRKALIQIEW